MVLKIFRAADAFLYLPTYIAEEYGIFETLLKPLGIKKVEFYTSDKGDIQAIKSMLDENGNTQESISIAIADPVAFLSKQLQDIQINNVRVIGAIINKLPFWAVNHTDKKFESLNDFNKEFSEVIYYNETLVTGHYLGIKVKNSSKLAGHGVAFGEEISTLNKYASENPQKKAVAITADIISLAKGKCLSENQLKINYWFSRDGAYLTTGILTSKSCGDQNRSILNKIIEAIQKSISILYSSTKIAERICETISKKPTFNSSALNPVEIKTIIDLIYDEQFYPADLNISQDGWNSAIKAIAKTEHWENEEEKEVINISFWEYVDNSFVLSSEKSIADQFGINLATFEDEIEDKIKKPLESEIEILKQELDQKDNKIGKSFLPFLWLSRNISSFILNFNNKIVLIVTLVVAVISVSIYLLKFVNDEITMKDIYTSLILGFFASTISAIFILVIQSIQKKKNDIKN